MIVHDSPDYRIEHLPSVNVNRPYALDHKERKAGVVQLNNLGWFETAAKAHQEKNRHAGWSPVRLLQESDMLGERYYRDRRILVDGEETWLLRTWVSDSGLVVEVSGPRSLLLAEHTVTERDGSELQLETGASRHGG